MAYSAREHNIIAYAVALHSGNVAAALRYIRDNCIEVNKIGDTTLRRLMDQPEFLALVTEQARVIASERENATRLQERERLKREMAGSFGERISQMESQAWKLFEILNAEIEKAETDKLALMPYWKSLMTFITQLKGRAAPAISEMWQAEALLNAYQKILMKRLGAAVTEQIQREVGRAYQDALTAQQARDAEQSGTGILPVNHGQDAHATNATPEAARAAQTSA
jgi:hypothetical protein